MELIIVLYIACSYLAAGLVVLLIFNHLTGRIKRNLSDIADEARLKIAGSSNTFNAIAGPAGQMPPLMLGKKMTITLLLVVTWLTWPLVLIGYSRSRGEDNAE